MRSDGKERGRGAPGESEEASGSGHRDPAGAAQAWRVHGRVQGVGFRWWTERTGTRLGLRGWVGNCRDGTVEVRAAGAPDALAALGRALAEGPPHALVERVEEVSVGALSIRADVPEAGFTIAR